MPRVPGLVAAAARADCEVGAELTTLLGLPAAVTGAVLCAFERYDGKGAPAGRSGDERAGAGSLRRGRLRRRHVRRRRRSGRSPSRPSPGGPGAPWIRRSPASSSTRRASCSSISDPDDLWAAVVAAEPEPQRFFRDDDHLDEVLAGFGDAADLKAPFFQGHSRGVALLARAAAAELEGVEPRLVYRAGLVHDLGRVAVPTGVWEQARAAAAGGVGAGAAAPLPLRPDPVAVAGPGAARPRSRADTTSGWTARATRWASRAVSSTPPQACSPPRTCGTRWASRAPTGRRCHPRTPPGVISSLPLDRDAVRAVLGGRPRPAADVPAAAGRPHRARARGAAPPGRRAHQEADRRRAVHLARHGAHPHGARLRQVRGHDPRRSGDVRHAARPRRDAWSEPGPDID